MLKPLLDRAVRDLQELLAGERARECEFTGQDGRLFAERGLNNKDAKTQSCAAERFEHGVIERHVWHRAIFQRLERSH